MRAIGLTAAVLLLGSGGVGAADKNYVVSGYGEKGYRYGEVAAEKGSREVQGYLYDEAGNSVQVTGESTDSGTIEAYDKNRKYIELKTE